MVALRVVVVTLALFALSVHCTSVTFNDMTSPDPTLANIVTKWAQTAACWTQTGGGASFDVGTAGCQGQSFGNAQLKYISTVSSVSSGTPATTGYVCTKFTFGNALVAADTISVGDSGGNTVNFVIPIGTTGTTTVGAQFTLDTGNLFGVVSVNSPVGNAAITTTLNEYRHYAVLTQYKAFTNNPTFVAGGTKSSVGGFQFDGGQTPVSDTITPGGTGQAVTGSFSGSTTTTPITYGFTPNANWAAASDGQTYSLTLTDSAVYKPPASAGATCTAGAQTLTATVAVNVVMVTAITSPTNNADLFVSDSVLVEKFGGTGSYGVTATASTDTTQCSWTDTTGGTKTATGATFTTNTVNANGGTLTVTCPGTGAGSGVKFTTTSYPIKVVQMGTISVPTGGGYASTGNKLVTGTGSNPTISIIKSLDTTQITFTTTSAGTFGTNPATGGGPFTTLVSNLSPTDNTKTITATAQYKGAAGTSAITDVVTLNIVYVSITTFTDTTPNSQQTANCPGGYASPCIVASTTTPTVAFSTVGTGFDTQGIVINGGAVTTGGTGVPGGSTQSITFAVGQDKATVVSRVANSAVPTFTIDSNGTGSTATNKQYTLAFLSVSAGTTGLKVTSANANPAQTSCVMSPTTTTCTFQVGGTAFNLVDVVETGGTGLGKTGISVTPGGSITSNAGAASDDGSTVAIKASISGVAGYVETSAQSISIFYLSVSAFQTKVTPPAVPNGGTNYVYFAPNANTLGLSTVGTGFDTVVYNGFGGGGPVTDTSVAVTGAAPSRTVTSGPKTYTVVLADDNKAISLVISNAAVNAATTYAVPAATFGITLIYTQVKPGVGTGNGLFFTGAAASNAGTYPNAQACVATVTSNTCTFTVAGNSFNGYSYKTSNGGAVTGTSSGAAAPTIGATSISSITTPALSTAEDGATLTATIFEAGSAAYTTRPTDTTSAAPLYYLSVSTFETNTVPTAFKNAGNYYVVLNSATTLKLQTIGTGFNTVSYTANLGTLKTTPQGSSAGTTAGTDSTWLTGTSPNRVATQPQLAITGLTGTDNTAVVSTTVSNKAVSSTVTYTPANALNIVYLSESSFSVTAVPATIGATCYATPASSCTFTLKGTGFDTFDYTSSAATSVAKATSQAATVTPPTSTATWIPALDYRDTTGNAAMPVTMTYTAYYAAQPAPRLTITGSLPLIFVSDIEFATGNKYTPLTNSQATPNTLNLFAAGDNTATSPNPKINGKGTGFTNAKVQRKNAGGMFVDVVGYLPCTVGSGGTSTATYDCPLIPNNGQVGFLPADDQAQFQVVLWNSGNTAVTYTTSAITVTVFGFKTDPPVSLVGFTTVRTPPYNPPTTNFVSYTYALVDANGVPTAPGNNVPQTQTWRTFAGDAVRDPVMPATAMALGANSIITFLVSANAALSSIPNAPWTAGGTFVGKNGDSYKITLTLSGVSTFRQTSFQLVTFSYFSGSGTQPNANGDYLYDYYAGYTGPKAANPPNYVPPNPEPAYSINVRADHLAPLDRAGVIKVGYTNACTLTVTPGTGGLVGPTLSQGPQNNVDAIQFLVDCTQSTDPSQPNCVYNQVEKLNGATLQVACTGDPVYTSTTPSPYGASVPLVIKYPAKMGLLPTNTWTSTPAGFCSGYAGQYPEPGHWDYDQPLTVNFNWAKLGNPAVTAIQQVMTWDIRTVSSSGTPLAIANSGGFPGAPTVLNGANPIAYQISNGVALTIAQARDIYFNNYLTVTAKFTGTGGTPLLTPFTITFQPLDVSIDNGILQPHFPPVLATTPALLAPQFNNFADVGGFVWQPPPLGFIVKHGFPKHDSPFGNSKYTTVAIPVFPNRNYDQILETRVTVAFGQQFAATSPTTYDNKYQYFTSVAANLVNAPTTKSFTEPKAGVVSNAYTNGIPGVYAVTSTITPTGPLWTYNKWIYRWILGVYKVSGQYEPYVVPTVNVFDPTALTYKYHTASSGFEGVWNWYPREFTPSLCPSVPTGNPFDIGTTDALVVPTTTASMYPSPDAGVLSWAYSHQTAGPSFRIDSTLASGILSGAQNSNTALLPSVSTVVHTFNSQYTVTIQQASATADAFGPQTTENLGYTVIASGKISSIVSADANSIITARYSHTLPFYLLLAPDGNPTTSGQRTLVGYPTVVTVNNCKVITTLANNTPFTVNSHRAGETFVLSLSSVTVGGKLTVTIVDATPGTMDTAQKVIDNVDVATGASPVFRFTAGYNLAGSALTKSTIKYSGITGTVKLSYHEFSSIPANWPFANDPAGAVIGAYANNEAVKTCVGQKVSVSSVSGTTAPGFGVPKTAQYFGCGTTNQVTPPTC